MAEPAASTERDQRSSALARANEVRIARATLKKELRQGKIRIEQILASPPECVANAQIVDLLVAVPRFGPVKAARLLNTAYISSSKTVGGLSDRQRTRLIELLRHSPPPKSTTRNLVVPAAASPRTPRPSGPRSPRARGL